jgi:MFS superfamily sulfate permease-like transporter
MSAIAIQLLWPKLGGRWQWLPGALPAVVVVTLVGLAFEMPRVELGSLFGDAKAALLSWWSTPPALHSLGVFLIPALGLAMVASAETLLTARAVDTLAEGRGIASKARLDRELIAQGAGNAVSGFLGGMPLTGVIVRSAANLNFGAVSRWSTILHGVWIAIAVGFLPIVVTSIPLTALAAVLVVTGFKLLNPGAVAATFRARTTDGVLWATTFAAILATDLLRGLLIAVGASVVVWGLDQFKARQSDSAAGKGEESMVPVTVRVRKQA